MASGVKRRVELEGFGVEVRWDGRGDRAERSGTGVEGVGGRPAACQELAYR